MVQLAEPGLATVDIGNRTTDIQRFALEFGDEQAGRFASKRLAPESGKTTDTVIFDMDIDR